MPVSALPRAAANLVRAVLVLALASILPSVAHAGPGASLLVGGKRVQSFTAPMPAARVPLHRAGLSSQWVSLGPVTVPGRMLCVTPLMFSPLSIAAGSDGAGYWTGYSQDDAGWSPRGNELGAGAAQIANRLWSNEGGPTFERTCVVGTDGGIYYSDDDIYNNGSSSWATSTLNTAGDYGTRRVVRLLMDSGSINVCYLLVEASDVNTEEDGYLFMRSFDGGASFDVSRFVAANAADMWASRTGSGELVLAYAQDFTVHVDYSDALGDPWTEQGTFEDPNGSFIERLNVTAQETTTSGHIWVWENDALHGSTDAGATWSHLRYMDEPSAGTRGLCASITNTDLLLWTTFDRLHLSRDGGVTDSVFANGWPGNGEIHQRPLNVDCWAFNLVNTSAPAMKVRCGAGDAGSLGVTPGEEQFYISSGSGVWRWRADQAGGPELLTAFGCVSSEFHDTYTFGELDGYQLRSGTRDLGAMGFSSFGPPPGNLYWTSLITSSQNDVSNVVANGLPTPDDPIRWQQFPDGLLVIDGPSTFAAGFAPSNARHQLLVAHPTDPYRVYFGSDQLYEVSYDPLGNTFSTSVVPTPLTGAEVTGFAIAPSDPDKWYLTCYGLFLFYSDDAGANWTQVFTGSVPGPIDYDGNRQIRIVVNPVDADEAWLVGMDVTHTTDGGVTWTLAQIGLPLGQPQGWDLAYDNGSPPTAYLAAPTGPYQWTGSGWLDLAPPGGDMPAVECRSVEYVPTLDRMRFATWGRGLWDYEITNTTGVGDVARRLELAPSSNPLRGQGELRFSLPNSGHVKLELLDVAGRRVGTLLDEARPAGRGSASLDGRSLGVGVYFARLTTAGGTRTSKVVVVH
ncbi:MAG: T9SS type A sorting domain-containing protein [Candidatus Eisenbacteria bacterium]|nr:T9SS type A sorting domain-containing protein [Candidatus Eisenbacteria bacterium]